MLLIDEFDLIERDLAPFRALTGRSLRARVEHLRRTVGFSWTIRVGREGVVREGGERDGPRSTGVAELMRSFVHLLPIGMTAVFYAHDGPAGHLSWAERKRYADLVSRGQCAPRLLSDSADARRRPRRL